LQDAIRSDAAFRQKFIEMCASLGVDPMSSNKTFSAKLGFGSFYTELGVQVLDVCMRTRSSNGGLIGLQDLTKRVISLRGANSGGIQTEDILRAVRSLQVKNPSSRLFHNHIFAVARPRFCSGQRFRWRHLFAVCRTNICSNS
jgi:ESCRT-II complex subunit VPS22